MNEPPFGGLSVVPAPDDPDRKQRSIVALEFLLEGLTDEDKLREINRAFYDFAKGDPNGFGVQFAVLLQAHCLSMKAFPERSRQLLEDTLKTFRAMMLAYQTSLKTSAEAVNQHATAYASQFDAIKAEFNRELKAHQTATAQQVEAITAGVQAQLSGHQRALEQKTAELTRLVKASESNGRSIAAHAETLRLAKPHLYWFAGVALFMFGVVAFPIIIAVFDAIRGWLHF
jgi:hypothetical protein